MKGRNVEFFLHEVGYTYFTIPGLTYIEINRLIEEHNDRQSEIERQSKKRRR